MILRATRLRLRLGASLRSRGLAAIPGAVPGSPPLDVYVAAVQSGALREDAHQLAALEKLQRLHHELAAYEPPPPPPPPPPPTKGEWKGPQFDEYGQPVGGGTMYTGVSNDGGGSGGGSWFGRLFGGGAAAAPAAAPPRDLSSVSAPRGVYMHGGVGCGKSLMMDSFFECCPVPAARKRRLHFNEFMLEVHKRMHEWRVASPQAGDPLPYIAHDIGSATQLLCFDEFQVTDVADALVMRRLFAQLFSMGLTMVATSNRPPAQLYLNGIQRDSFVPFIHDLEARCEVHDLASKTDYRMVATVSAGARTYMHPLGAQTDAEMDALFAALAKGGRVAPQTLRLRGRDLHVPRAAVGAEVARFSFDQLCGAALGAEDYLGVASAYHTVFVDGVPAMDLSHINQVRRFITLVDALYDKQVKLVLSAAAPPEALFSPDGAAGGVNDPKGDLIGTAAYVPDSKDEVFAFGRTVSRLNEMQSHDYLIKAQTDHARAEKNALLLFESQSLLSSAEAQELFARYDVDASGVLERPEVRLLLQDLSERRTGHRNVLEEQVDHAFATMDGDGDGEVSREEFVRAFAGAKLSSVRVLRYFGEDDAPPVAAAGVSRAARPPG